MEDRETISVSSRDGQQLQVVLVVSGEVLDIEKYRTPKRQRQASGTVPTLSIDVQFAARWNASLPTDRANDDLCYLEHCGTVCCKVTGLKSIHQACTFNMHQLLKLSLC